MRELIVHQDGETIHVKQVPSKGGLNTYILTSEFSGKVKIWANDMQQAIDDLMAGRYAEVLE